MADASSPREIAAAWQPERPGRRAVKDLADALVEPDWGGVRVAASLDGDGAAFWRDGAEVVTPAELPAALVDAFRAVDAVVEGHLTTMALRPAEGVLPTMPTIERPPLIIPRAIRQGPQGRSVRPPPGLRVTGGCGGARDPRRAASGGSATHSSPRTCCGWTVSRWTTCRSWSASATWRPSSSRRSSSA